MSNLKFWGSAEEFKALLMAAGFRGPWEDKGANGLHYRDRNGVTITYWEKKGTVLVQGKIQNKTVVEKQVQALLEDGEILTTKDVMAAEGRIFVVHGHDSDTRDDLELALHRLGLEPFILMNSSGGGLTIIEALEGHIGKEFESSFGIVLMTPDDMGYAIAHGPDKIEPRARQNVILETGMLLSSLTRRRMVVLVKGHLEKPSDLQGLIYLGFNDHVKEIIPKLVARLREAGIKIDERRVPEAMA